MESGKQLYSTHGNELQLEFKVQKQSRPLGEKQITYGLAFSPNKKGNSSRHDVTKDNRAWNSIKFIPILCERSVVGAINVERAKKDCHRGKRTIK